MASGQTSDFSFQFNGYQSVSSTGSYIRVSDQSTSDAFLPRLGRGFLRLSNRSGAMVNSRREQSP
jgi:hypothetical protein